MKSCFFTIFFVFLSVVFDGCAGKKSIPPETGVSLAKPYTAEMGPPLPSGVEISIPKSQGEMGPELVLSPSQLQQEGYVLVLGPGLARGIAYLGVIREMEEKQLLIRGIVGVEMGAIIGSVWASSNINNLEWIMHKFKKETLLDFPLLGQRLASGKKLIKFLKTAIRVELLQKMKVPVLVASSVWKSQKPTIIFENAGSSFDIVRGALGIPGLLKPYSWQGVDRVTAGLELPFPSDQARAMGLGKVMCVDVINGGDNFVPKENMEEFIAAFMRSVASIARQNLKNCDVVLSIPVDGISYLDFDSKAELIFRGRNAVKQWLAQKE